MATAKKRVSAKRSAAAKKGWRTRRRKTSGTAKSKSKRRDRVTAACSAAGKGLKVRRSSRSGRRLATSKRRGGCK